MARFDVYLEVARKSFQRQLAYRAANVAGIITNTFFGAIYAFIFLALFEQRGPTAGLDARDVITYVVVSQSLLMAMSAFGNRDLSDAMIRGDIVIDLIRPVDFYLLWAALDLGRATYYLLFRGIPTFTIGWLLFRPRLIDNPVTVGLFLLCVALGMAMSFAFRFVIGSLAFWTTDARGLNYLASIFILFFAGAIVPLNFFPDGLRAIVGWLPFQTMAHLPISVYLGKVGGWELARILAVQGAWLTGFVALGRWVLGRVMWRLSVQGG